MVDLVDILYAKSKPPNCQTFFFNLFPQFVIAVSKFK